MLANNILELIGKTPIIKLNHIVGKADADLYVKMESMNPGGSVKDRIALSMIEEAEKRGDLKPGNTILEPTSGNTGIGLAMIGACKGYRVILIMPETMSIERRKLLQAYGAELVLTSGTEGMRGAVKKAEELAGENPDYFMPQQFNNPDNIKIHRETTAVEIVEDMEGKIDGFISGIGTGGTITGAGNVLKIMCPGITIVGVEPTASPILSGGKPGPHKIQGIGAGFVPGILDRDVYDEIMTVEEEEAISFARRLAKEEGILAGISSGAAVAAALRLARRLGTGKRVLTIVPSTGERYLTTTLFADGLI